MQAIISVCFIYWVRGEEATPSFLFPHVLFHELILTKVFVSLNQIRWCDRVDVVRFTTASPLWFFTEHWHHCAWNIWVFRKWVTGTYSCKIMISHPCIGWGWTRADPTTSLKWTHCCDGDDFHHPFFVMWFEKDFFFWIATDKNLLVICSRGSGTYFGKGQDHRMNLSLWNSSVAGHQFLVVTQCTYSSSRG